MANARRFECFCLDPNESLLFAGNISGQISIIDVDSFAIVGDLQAHSGVMRAIAVHPTLPYLAAYANDRCVSVWKRDDGGLLHPLIYTSVRDIECSNDEAFIPPILSHTVALGFHSTARRLVTRTGNGGVLELEFDDQGRVELLSRVRLHGDWDLQMAQYVPGTDWVLSAGRDGCLVLSERGREVRRWQFGETVAHWAEHLEGTTYLVASDAGLVARVDVAAEGPPLVGERFAHDDMEYVTYNKTSKRAFATSFDHNVYEVDPIDCASKGVVYSPGYKCIWAKTLERSPSTLVVQSRNGGLYKANVNTGETLSAIKETPPALWSAVSMPEGDFLLAGEGAYLTRLRYSGVDALACAALFETDYIPTDMLDNTYTKRMVRQRSTGTLVLGRRDGSIWTGTEESLRRLVDLGSPIRDVAVGPNGNDMFAAMEDGRVVAIDLSTGDIRRTYQSQGEAFPRAVWAIAYNQARELLALAEFGGDVRIISAVDFSNIDRFESERPKRMRWAGPDVLLLGQSDEVHRYTIGVGKPQALVTGMQNTVEDFIWDNRKQYLLVISYQATIALCDYTSGDKLDLVRDQMDYSKGLAWLDSSVDSRLYPWDFITWGRSGTAHHFRVHDERLLAFGAVSPGRASHQPRPAGPQGWVS